MAEERTTTDPASGPVPRARAAAEPPPAKAAKAAKKATKAAKKATKAVKRAKATEPATSKKATEPATSKKATKSAEATKPPTRPTAAPGAWTAAVREALSDVDQPPQRLAELAVAELGPRAAAWAGWLRDTYPDPPAHGIARLAVHEARQAGWALAAVEAGGPIAAALSLPAAAWVRAMLVLKIAAAHGHDPADPRRAADLIELLDLGPGEGRLTGILAAVRGHRRRLAGIVAARIGVRRAPLLAGLRMLIAGGDLREQLDWLAQRASAHYRHGSQDRMSASAASISSPNSP
jgi:hypothetical protein